MRLPDEDYEALQAMALLTGRPMAELVREAVTSSIEEFASSSELELQFAAELKAREVALQKLSERGRPHQQEDADAPADDPEAANEQLREPSAKR